MQVVFQNKIFQKNWQGCILLKIICHCCAHKTHIIYFIIYYFFAVVATKIIQNVGNSKKKFFSLCMMGNNMESIGEGKAF